MGVVVCFSTFVSKWRNMKTATFGRQTRLWSIEHKDGHIGPLSSYALALWGLQGLLYPNDIITNGQRHQLAGYLHGMQPFIRNNGHLRRAKLWSIAGGKGGVGKSILTALLGLSLARSGKRVIIVDADFDGANQRQIFGMRESSPNLWPLVDNGEGLYKAALPTQVENIRLITAPEYGHNAEESTILRRINFVRALRKLDAEYVLLDFGPRTDTRELAYFLTSDLNLVVTSPEPMALENLSKFIKNIVKQKLQLAIDSLSQTGSGESFVQNADTPLIHQALQHMRHLDLPAEELMRRIVGSFNLRIIFNQISDGDFLKDMKLLNLHLEREVGFQLLLAGAIPFDRGIRQAVRTNALTHLTPAANATCQRIQQICEQLIDSHNRIPHLFELKPLRTAPVDASTFICGTWCTSWGVCNFQAPGNVCPVRNIN